MNHQTFTKRISTFFLLILFILNTQCTSGIKKRPGIFIVEINNMKFIPAELSINKNDTVLFINKDMVAHDVTEVPSGIWSSGKLEPGNSWKTTFDITSSYYCSIHMVMNGKVVVK